MGMPELVLPAGDLEKLYTAMTFGADAVYAGGKQFSLRAYAGNLTLSEIRQGLTFAHRQGKRLYITVNLLAHNNDLVQMPAYLEALADIGVDGIIVADPGVLRLAGRHAPNLPVTISTQANVTNYEAAAFYGDQGAKRIVVSRELTLAEIRAIKERIGLEVEVFIHGAMCVSYSGRCLLSHYMTGRSGNRGECAHPCRYRYALMEEKRPGQFYPLHEDERGSYILNSRDLCLLEFLPELIEAGVDAFKVEGRMKSPLYVAAVAYVYQQALQTYASRPGPFRAEELTAWLTDLMATATRPFTSGFVDGPDGLLQDVAKSDRAGRAEFCGVVKTYDAVAGRAEVEQRANFGPHDSLFWLVPVQGTLPLNLEHLYDDQGEEIDRARHARQHVFVPVNRPIPRYSILYRKGANESAQCHD